MEESKLGKEAAFPSKSQHYSELVINKGMSKRFYAACAAIQGILANEHINPNGIMPIKNKVAIAYQYADELLKRELMKNDKWLMFKNYMHNELGITKEDIHQWIRDAVKEEAERLVKQQFGNFNVNAVIEKIIYEDDYYGSKSLKRDITNELARQLMDKIKLI